MSDHADKSNSDEQDYEVGPEAPVPTEEPDPPRVSWVDLGSYSNHDYDPGQGWLVRACWYFTSLLIFESGVFPFIRLKVWVLRRFGAKIGRGLVIKPHVRIKYPWRLEVRDHCWIGQGVWIDNLADVCLGNHVCLSQQAYICTGSHRFSATTFDLVVKPVTIDDGAWLAARSIVLGGVVIGANAIVSAGSVVTQSLSPATIAAGNPATPVSQRRVPPLAGGLAKQQEGSSLRGC